MTKLLELKEWVTLREGAGHLSTLLGVDVSEADVLQFGLEGRLVLSVNIVNPVTLKRGKIVPRESAPRCPGIPVEGCPPYEVVLGIELNDEEVLVLDKEVVQVSQGVLDLPMFGGDRLHVERLLQQLIGGPPCTYVNMDGTFLVDASGLWFQLQDEFRDGPPHLSAQAPVARRAKFFPAGSLGFEDLQLVLRPDSIFQFVRVSESQKEKTSPLSRKQEADYFALQHLRYWVRCDTWTSEEGLLLLSGMNPEGTVFLDPHPFGDYPGYRFSRIMFFDYRCLVQPDSRRQKSWTAQEVSDDDDIMGYNDGWQRLWRLWSSGDHPRRASPVYFVQWAQSKEVEIPWLKQAQELGHFVETPVQGSSAVEEPMEKPLATKERNVLLTIIGVLCRAAGVDYEKPAKAAGRIQNEAALMGVAIGETTIENHLKRIPEAITGRTK